MANTNEKLPKSIDLSHHLSEISKSRQVSPLKGLAKYWGKPGLISLAGGMPSAAYFPLSTLSAETLVKDSFALSPEQSSPGSSDSALSWFWRLFSPSPAKKERTEHISIPKYASSTEEVQLAVALQYGTAQGLIPLQRFMREFTERVYQPQYEDWTTLVHTGNTDGWHRAVLTLCNPGEMFLTEEWTYTSATAAAEPYGVRAAAVKIDSEGMRSDDLRKVLTGWNEEERGAKRPHVIYTAPIGQNPTGATMGSTRKKEVYDICVEYDIIIVEDDPCYFLQQPAYVPPGDRSHVSAGNSKDDEAMFVASLAPSYVKFDYQGRVIRLDSFSKTIAPGSRLGWFTCSERFAERFERQGETSTQAPCGFGQSIITQLLTKQWGYTGYIRWLRGLRSEYTLRRDFFVDELGYQFHLQPQYITQGVWAGTIGYVATPKPQHLRSMRGGSNADEKHASSEKTLFSFVPPTAGMFVWLKVHFENHPSFRPGEDKAKLEVKLWTALAEANVLVGPGYIFAANDDIQNESEGHLRISFSNAEYDTVKEAVAIMRKVMLEFFEFK